jgi:chromosome segregation ATPase
MRQQLDDKSREIIEAVALNDRLQRELTTLRTSVSDLMLELSQKDLLISDSTSANDVLREKWSAQTQELAVMSSAHVDLINECDSLKQSISTLEEQLHERDVEISGFGALDFQLRDELVERKAMVNVLREKLSVVRRKSADQEEQIACNEHEKEELRILLSQMQSELSDVRGRHTTVEARLRAVNQQMRDYKAQVRSQTERWLGEIGFLLPMVRAELEARECGREDTASIQSVERKPTLPRKVSPPPRKASPPPRLPTGRTHRKGSHL